MLKISREFWFTIVSFIFSGLYLFGILKSNDSKEELIEVVTHAVESVILIAGQGLIFYKYMKSRKDAKDREKGVIDIVHPYEIKPDNSEDTPIIEEELSNEREDNKTTDQRRSTEVNRRNKKVSKRRKEDRSRRSMENSTAINRSRNTNN